MASQDRSTANHIVYDLVKHSEQYSFYQAVQLLNDYHLLISNDKGKESLKETLIQFSVNPQLSHNQADIESIVVEQKDNKLVAQLSVNFLGLYGAASPLPVFYSEAILQAENGEDSTKDFMDLFNHRMISLVYKCWEKYRYYKLFKNKSFNNKSDNNREDGESDPFTNWMFALCGLVKPEQRKDPDIDWNRLLPFIGMLGMRCHSASMMESILRYYFKYKFLTVCSNMKRLVDIEDDQKNRLGQQCATLSHDLVLGDQVEDCSGMFRIKITNLSYERFVQFLPDGEYYVPMRKIINYILCDQLDYDIELQLLKQEVPTLLLSDSNQEKLGWTTWVGAKEQENKSVIVPGWT